MIDLENEERIYVENIEKQIKSLKLQSDLMKGRD